jgi:hypothetical protein
MATYNELLPTSYYLIQENENSSLELVYVMMTTGKCVLIEYQDDDQTMSWFKKTDEIFEITEQLTEEQAVIFESLFEDEEDEDGDWNEDDDIITPWFGDDDEGENDEKIKALNN